VEEKNIMITITYRLQIKPPDWTGLLLMYQQPEKHIIHLPEDNITLYKLLHISDGKRDIRCEGVTNPIEQHRKTAFYPKSWAIREIEKQ
jgi:hypothetical protein